MFLPWVLISSVLAFVLAGIMVFLSAIGRIVHVDKDGVSVKLFIRGRKRLPWDQLKPGRLTNALGMPILVLERKHDDFLSNPADFLLVVNLPEERGYLEAVRDRLGIVPCPLD